MRTLIIFILAVLTTVKCGYDTESESYEERKRAIFQIHNNTPKPQERTGCGPGSKCVLHYHCKNGVIIEDGKTIIDLRFGTDEKPHECDHYLMQCCKYEDYKVSPVTIQPPPIIDGCGFRNVNGIGHKTIGIKHNETQYGEFPWMVAILNEVKAPNRSLNVYKCGGSLVHPSVVLTAAHCVFDIWISKSIKSLKIRAGEWDTKTKNEMYPHQDRAVADIVFHPHFEESNAFNDIALLFLESPVELSNIVRPICLPPSGRNFDHSRCIATGWGKDAFGRDGKYQDILKKIELPIVPRDQCQESLRESRLGPYFRLHSSFICAGGEAGIDTCKGDGGSPLVCPIDNTDRYVQAGIVSWGIGCKNAYPAAYVSVAELRPWLDEQLAYKKIDNSYYTPRF